MATKTLTVYADRDARIYQPNLGAGHDTVLPVGLWSGGDYRSLIHFPSPDYVGLKIRRIVSVKLHLRNSTQLRVARGATPRMLISRHTANWSEGTATTLSSSNAVTWPGPSATAAGQVDTGTLSTTDDAWIVEDITAIGRAWAPSSVESGGGQPNYGIRLSSYDEASTARTTEFYSRETSSDPYLVYTYEDNTNPTAPTVTNPVTNADGTPALFPWQTGSHGTTRSISVSARQNDPDSGDYITAAQLQVFADSATDATPGAALADTGSVAVSGAPTGVTITKDVTGALVAGVTYRLRVRTADKAGAWSPYSPLASARFIPGTAPTVGQMGVGPSVTPDLYGSIVSADNRSIASVRVLVYQDTLSGAVLKWDSDWQSAGGSRFVLSYGGSALDVGSKYRWAAQITDQDGFVGPLSAYASWTVSEIVGPDAMAPTDLRTKAQSLTPTLTVGHSQSFDAHELQVALVPTPVLDDDYLWRPAVATYALGTSRLVTYAGAALTWGKTYYWRARVRIAGVTWSEWSPWYPLYINATPDAPKATIDGAVDSGNGYVVVTSTQPTIRAPFSDPDLLRDVGEFVTKEEIFIRDEVTNTYLTGYGPLVLTAGITATHKIGTALTVGHTYAVQVRYTDNAGQVGPPSTVIHLRASTPPTATLAGAPDVADPTPTLSWTYASTAGKVQRAYRVTVTLVSTGAVVYDSGRVVSVATAHTVPAGVLADATTYDWQVVVEDSDGLTSDMTTTVVTAFSGSTSLAPTVFAVAVSGTAAVIGTFQSEVNADGPVADFGLGEASGSFVDKRGGASGTGAGGLTRGVTGLVPGGADAAAVTFDGSTGKITVPDEAALDLGDGPFSIEFWARRSRVGVTEVLIDKGVTGGIAYTIYYASTNQLRLADSQDGNAYVSCSSLITDLGTHHFVFTKNGTDVHAYMDGVEATTAGSNVTALVNNTAPLTIGAAEAGGNEYGGTLDEVKIYKKVLTPDRVAAHYAAAGLGGGGGGGGTGLFVTDTCPTAPSLASDQSAAIQSWINATAGPGKVLGFAPGTYRTDTRIVITANDCTIYAPGVTFHRTIAPPSSNMAIFELYQCQRIWLEGFTVTGIATATQIRSRSSSYPSQDEHCFAIDGVQTATLKNLNVGSVLGDGAYWHPDDATSTTPTDLTFIGVHASVCGRNGFSHISGRRITLTDCAADVCTLHAFDVEPNRSTDVTEDLVITNFTAGDYNAALTDADPGYACAIGAGGGAVAALRVTLDGIHITPPVGDGQYPGLYIQGPSSTVRHNTVTVKNCTTTHSASNPVAHVNGWTNTNNDGLAMPASGNIA